jgi:hypothetical protein
MVIARSLVNVCIDLAYICKLDSDDRTEQWIARVERVEVIEEREHDRARIAWLSRSRHRPRFDT